MDYDTHGGGASAQEDQWLDDLKSLLDDQPGIYGRSQAPSGGKSGNPYVQQGRAPQPSYAGSAQSQGHGWDQNYSQNWGGVQNQARGQAPIPGYAYAQPLPPSAQVDPWQAYGRPVKPDKPERKKSVYGSIIALSIIITLEAAAIAALAIHWIQWMA